MKRWTIEISQNGWEYKGYAYIDCNEVIRGELDESENTKIIYADGMRIEFEEVIGEISSAEIQ